MNMNVMRTPYFDGANRIQTESDRLIELTLACTGYAHLDYVVNSIS